MLYSYQARLLCERTTKPKERLKPERVIASSIEKHRNKMILFYRE